MDLSVYKRYIKGKRRVMQVCKVRVIKGTKVGYGFGILPLSPSGVVCDFDPLLMAGRSWVSKQYALDEKADERGWRWCGKAKAMPQVEMNFNTKMAKVVKEM